MILTLIALPLLIFLEKPKHQSSVSEAIAE